MAAQSFVKDSFEDEFSTFNSNINGTHYILSSLKDISPDTKFYFAGSSEMFGKVSESPQNENTRFHPRSPYGISKVTGYDLTRNYREAYKIFAVSGILFNHESPRRGFEFVTRKISLAVAKIKNNLQNDLVLGNLQAQRDWGYAKDYVQAMWLMLQNKNPEDYVVGTGITKSIEEFVKLAFNQVGLNYLDYVKYDKKFLRPAEVDLLVADSSKVRSELGWKPSINFDDLVGLMVESDLKKIRDNKSN